MMKKILCILLATACVLSLAVCLASCSKSGGRTFEDIYKDLKSDVAGYKNYKMTVEKVSTYTAAAGAVTVFKQNTVKVYNEGKYYTSQTKEDAEGKDIDFRIWFAEPVLTYFNGTDSETREMTGEQFKAGIGADVTDASKYIPEIASEYLKDVTVEKVDANRYGIRITLPLDAAKDILQPTGILEEKSEVMSYEYLFVFNNDDTFDSVAEYIAINDGTFISEISRVITISGNPTDADIPAIPD